MFYREKPYSLTEVIFSLLPEDAPGSNALLGLVMNTKVFSFFFEELKQFGANRRLDLRCSFSKDFLREDGHLKDVEVSRLYFREGDIIDFDLHFGCGVYVFNSDMKLDRSESQAELLSIESLVDMMSMLTASVDDESKWKPFRSFFMSTSTRFELDLSSEARLFQPFGLHGINMISQFPFVFGRIKNVTPVIHELKVYNGHEAVEDEAHKLNEHIMNLRQWPNSLQGIEKTIVSNLLNISVPLLPFPSL